MAENYPKIFINYRRKDARGLVETLYNHLSTLYGKESIFFDQSSIKKGQGITDTIKQNLRHCTLFLPVIGPNWDRRSYLKRIKEPNDWVRQEMELAIQYKMHIIPILIDRESVPGHEKIPASIKRAIFDLNAIKLQEDTTFWDEELKRFQQQIQVYTELPLNKVENKPDPVETAKRNLRYLNRNEEYGKVEEPMAERQNMFAACVTRKSGVIYFVQRCGCEILDQTEIKSISWNEFEKKNKKNRKKYLINKVALAIGGIEKNLNDQDKIMQIQTHFRGKKFVFYSIRFNALSNNHNQGNIKDWWAAWEEIIGLEQRRNILVFLFTIPSWVLYLKIFSRFPKDTVPENLGYFRDIKRSDVEDWNAHYLGPENISLSDKDIAKLFFLCRTKNHQIIEHKLLDSVKE